MLDFSSCCFTCWICVMVHRDSATLLPGPRPHPSSGASWSPPALHPPFQVAQQWEAPISFPTALWCHPVCYPPRAGPLPEGAAQSLHWTTQKTWPSQVSHGTDHYTSVKEENMMGEKIFCISQYITFRGWGWLCSTGNRCCDASYN